MIDFNNFWAELLYNEREFHRKWKLHTSKEAIDEGWEVAFDPKDEGYELDEQWIKDYEDRRGK